MKFQPDKPPVFAETPESLALRLAQRNEPSFRAGQVFKWIYKERARSPDQMTNLPRPLREWLSANFDFAPNTPVLGTDSSDVTRKILQRLRDGSLIETVILRAPRTGKDNEKARTTLCVSTQIGCAYGCRFCASGLKGWKRDLSAGEIVAQVMSALENKAADTLDNLVVMGMGEPLANYDNLIAALRILNAPWALGLGARRMTISTSGIVPKILTLAEEPLDVRLAVSLHGSTNAVRDKIMPINKQYPLETLLPACKTFAEKHGRMLTFEFILIAGVNDSIDQARSLAKIAREIHAHVNLIPCNPVAGLPWKRPSIARQQAFTHELHSCGISVTLRREKGTDIAAACGQLRLQVENGEANQSLQRGGPKSAQGNALGYHYH
ncbi:MAG: 23S rRNA (adenine(2503)-C(2))-methyltransferase RlmN [Puniceicoccales bacterium]|jgi:23S rRNA (adenine2503-C2)-methyltransferase|nr:23S rRNA (adenine(2503)-C(2))-methyltransferase RlmN [Puniceicoccales bacterium]